MRAAGDREVRSEGAVLEHGSGRAAGHLHVLGKQGQRSGLAGQPGVQDVAVEGPRTLQAQLEAAVRRRHLGEVERPGVRLLTQEGEGDVPARVRLAAEGTSQLRRRPRRRAYGDEEPQRLGVRKAAQRLLRHGGRVRHGRLRLLGLLDLVARLVAAGHDPLLPVGLTTPTVRRPWP